MRKGKFWAAAAMFVALSASSISTALAEVDPFPNLALGAEVPGTRVMGQIEITCPDGSSRGILVDVSAHQEYTVCNKSWRPAAEINADIVFRQAQIDAMAAAEAESKAWAAAHPGQQKCIQWGPIVHANGVSTSSGGVCANSVPVPAGYVAETGTVVSDTSTQVVDTATPVIVQSSVAPVNTNGFGGYAVVHPDGHVCGVIVSGSSDPFGNGGVMPQEYMGCPPGSRIVFQSAPSADGNVAGWHGPDVVLSNNTYTLPGGSTLSGGIVTDTNGRTWNSGTGAVITPGRPDTRTAVIDTPTVVSDTATVLVVETPTVTSFDTGTAVMALSASVNTVDAVVVANKTRIAISTEWSNTYLTVVATKKGTKKKYTFQIKTDGSGDFLLKSNVNLKGFTVVLMKGKEELDRDKV